MSPEKEAVPKAASETQLIARAQRGDESAFAALFEAHKRRVYSLCLRMTGDVAEAEDLSQEAFLQLFRKIGTFRGESAFSTWLHRLVVNVVLMHLRKKGIQQVPLEETDSSQEEPVRREYGDEDKRLMRSIDRISLDRAIAQLPPGYRAVFVLHDVEGYEHNEIAQIMNYSVGNSKSQLHKARLKLRDWLREHRTGELASGSAADPTAEQKG
ncbi:MAG: RNA polymerase subunit sigma-24 [Acidobacteria bacterium]|nr:MAG: RNA polymerase subunit sigma-24 [Acidobacteriota bacterium]